MGVVMSFSGYLEHRNKQLRSLLRGLGPSGLVELLSTSITHYVCSTLRYCFGGSSPSTLEPEVVRLNLCMNSNHMRKGLEYWHLPGASDASFAVVVVPGNPGIGSLYTPFARVLQRTLRGKANSGDVYPVYTVSYYGFEQPRDNRRRPSSLDINQEPDRLRAFLDFVYAKEAKPLIVIGHSIGAWVVVKAIGSPNEYCNPHAGERYPTAHHIHQIVLLMPFLEVDTESRIIRTLTRVVQFRLVRNLLTLIMHVITYIMPLYMLRLCVLLAATGRINIAKLRGCSSEVANNLVETFGTSAHYVCATMSLAHSEMHTLRRRRPNVARSRSPMSRHSSSTSVSSECVLSAPSLALLSSPTVNYGSGLDPLRQSATPRKKTPERRERREDHHHNASVDSDTDLDTMYTAESESGRNEPQSPRGTFFQYYANKIVMLYVADDHWGPLKDASMIMEKTGSSDGRSVLCQVMDGPAHAFVLDAGQTQIVAETIAKFTKTSHPIVNCGR